MEAFVRFLENPDLDDRQVQQWIRHLSQNDRYRLAVIVNSPRRAWTLESLRTVLVGLFPNLPRAVHVAAGALSHAILKRTHAELEAEYVNEPLPRLDLVEHVRHPLGDRAVGMYRSREYAWMVQEAVDRLTDPEAMELFYTAFSTNWNPLATAWFHEEIRFNTMSGRRSAAAFAMHYWTLHRRVDTIKRDRPHEARDIAFELRPVVRAHLEARKALRVPAVPKVLQHPD